MRLDERLENFKSKEKTKQLVKSSKVLKKIGILAYIYSRLKSKPSTPDLVKKNNLWGNIELTNINYEKQKCYQNSLLEPEGEIHKLKDNILQVKS